METKAIWIGLLGLVVGSLIGFNASHYLKSESSPPQDHSINHGTMTMQDMSVNLRDKTGDEFDKAFIEGMIEHHQGALDMANQASASAKHQEIKDLSIEIIKAQTSEINLMNSWKESWGY